MRNGMLVGYVPEIEGSDSLHRGADHRRGGRADYDKPIATLRPQGPESRHPALPIKGGLFRQVRDGFRYK